MKSPNARIHLSPLAIGLVIVLSIGAALAQQRLPSSVGPSNDLPLRNRSFDNTPMLYKPPVIRDSDRRVTLPFFLVAKLVLPPLGLLVALLSLVRAAKYKLASLSAMRYAKDIEAGEEKRPWTELSFLTPLRVRVILSVIVVARFMGLWYVFERQSRLYAQMELVPNNSISHYVTQAHWNFYRPYNVGINPFRLINTYLLQLAVIWLAAPLIWCRSYIWRSMKKCCLRQESATLTSEEGMALNGIAEKSERRSAIRYAFWFLVVTVMLYIPFDVVNKLMLETYSIPIAQSDGIISAPIISFVSAVGYNPNAVFVEPDDKNAASGGIFLTPMISIGSTLIERMLSMNETLAIIAHEVGHWQHRHGMFTFAQQWLVIAITFVGAYYLRNFTPLYAAFGYAPGRTKPWVLTRCLIVGYFVLSPVWALYRPYANRSNWAIENEADDYAQQLGYAAPLCSALVRMSGGMLLMMDPLFHAVMADHTPLAQRLARLGC